MPNKVATAAELLVISDGFCENEEPVDAQREPSNDETAFVVWLRTHKSHLSHPAGRQVKKKQLEERLDNKAECAICSLAGEEVTYILFTLEKWFEGFGAGARECGNQVMATFAKDASHIMRPRFRFLCYAVETQRKDKKKLIWLYTFHRGFTGSEQYFLFSAISYSVYLTASYSHVPLQAHAPVTVAICTQVVIERTAYTRCFQCITPQASKCTATWPRTEAAGRWVTGRRIQCDLSCVLFVLQNLKEFF